MVALAAFAIPALGQEAADTPAPGGGYIDDWTHHHVVFSNPGTREDAVKHGTLDKWQKITNDPRYQLQLSKRSARARPVVADPNLTTADPNLATEPGRWGGGPPERPIAPFRLHPVPENPIEKDWSEPLGGVTAAYTGTVGTLSSSSISSSSTLTIAGLPAGTVTLTASAPTPEEGTIVFSSTAPCTGYHAPVTSCSSAGSVVLGNTTYNFVTTASTPGYGNQCNVVSAASGTGATNLYDAIFGLGTAGSGTYECRSGDTPNTAFNSSTSNLSGSTITLYAATPGSTGFGTFTNSRTNFTTFTSTAGTNGTQTSSTTLAPTFVYWSGNNYATSAATAQNICSALQSDTDVTAEITVGPTTCSTSGGTVTLTPKSGDGPYIVTASGFSALTPADQIISATASDSAIQPNAYPAKYGASLTAASCSGDFVIYPTGQAGSATSATIVAYNNIYSSCSGTVPSVAWAYNTSNLMTGYSATTSPILSEDGTKVAFIQSNGSSAYLVVLKFGSGGAVNSPNTPTAVTSPTTGNNITNCATPCMTITELNNNDTYSSPYYDYDTTSDNLWVGDNSGYLEQFTGVFKGSVAISGSPWPAHLNLGTVAVSSPVLDTISGYILVGDMGGTLYSVGSGTAGTAPASVHGNTGVIADAFADGPLVDSNTGRVFAFANQSKTSTYTGDNVVFGLTTAFTNATNIGTSPLTVTVNNGTAGHYLYSGDFDNVYYQSSNGTGNIYAVGDTGLATGASLYRIGLSGGNLIGGSGVTQAVTGLSDGYAWPSPLTEFCNGACTVSGGVTNSGTDYVFFSVNQGAKGTCTGTAGNGCVMSYNVSNPSTAAFSGAQNYTNVGTSGCWATGGLVIDNDDDSTGGASQIYLIGLNGAEAGNPSGATSSACSAGAASGTTIQGIQASQSAP
jgi:hypothetical protein